MKYIIDIAIANKVSLLLVLQIKEHLLFYIAKCHDKDSSIRPLSEFKLRNVYKDLSKGKVPFSVTISLDTLPENFTPQTDIVCKDADHVISTEYEFQTPEVNFNIFFL